ncbi:MAG: signal peptidase II [Patescibacteria group bacterium]|nr:signal peptidase II [Patescibacteria group bacterium]
MKSERTAGRGAFVFYLAFGAALVLIDQLVKHFAFSSGFGNFLNVWPPAIRKYLFFNSQFAFSLPLPPWLMYLLYAIILFFMGAYVKKKMDFFSRPEAAAWTLIFAGAVSNIAERILSGHVRDFIYLFSGIFNLADFYIILGIVVLLWYQINKPKRA